MELGYSAVRKLKQKWEQCANGMRWTLLKGRAMIFMGLKELLLLTAGICRPINSIVDDMVPFNLGNVSGLYMPTGDAGESSWSRDINFDLTGEPGEAAARLREAGEAAVYIGEVAACLGEAGEAAAGLGEAGEAAAGLGEAGETAAACSTLIKPIVAAAFTLIFINLRSSEVI